MNILGAVGGADPKPIELTFQGFKTMQNHQPTKARVMYIDVVQDEHHTVLEKIADMIIRKFLEKGITTEKELDHVKYNPRSQMYEVNFHMTALRSPRNKTMDATELLAQYADCHLGKTTLKEIHISNRFEFEAPDGQRMARKLFEQIKDHEASYACESKIMLNYDDF